jgi:hypothetical protein
MKTIILFSSIFYLIGLTVGSTIEGVKKALIPSKSIISSPLKNAEKGEKTFHFKSDEGESKPKKVETDSNKESGSAKQTAPGDTIVSELG